MDLETRKEADLVAVRPTNDISDSASSSLDLVARVSRLTRPLMTLPRIRCHERRVFNRINSGVNFPRALFRPERTTPNRIGRRRFGDELLLSLLLHPLHLLRHLLPLLPLLESALLSPRQQSLPRQIVLLSHLPLLEKNHLTSRGSIRLARLLRHLLDAFLAKSSPFPPILLLLLPKRLVNTRSTSLHPLLPSRHLHCLEQIPKK